MKSITRCVVPLAVFALLFGLPACSRPAGEPTKVTGTASASNYVPGLGDIMRGMQVHHANLWFAGEAKNWTLAAYEMAQIAETMDDVQKLHPTFEGNSMTTSLGISMFTSGSRKALDKSIATKDATAFQESFDALSAACNTCHQNFKHDFIQITRPSKPPFTNQIFQPK